MIWQSRLRSTVANLERTIANLEARLQQQEQELCQANERCNELQAHVTFLHNPQNLRTTHELVACLLSHRRPLPDDFHEHALRLQLRHTPYDLELTYSLVALLHRTGRAPLPDPILAPDIAPPPEMPDVEALIQLGHDQVAQAGDTFRLYAALWQACVRFSGSLRGWAEFARCFADRGEWDHCLAAAHHVLAANGTPDTATAVSMLHALSALAEEHRLDDLPWRDWISRLPCGLHAHPHLASLLLETGEAQRAVALLPKTTGRWSDQVETWLAAARIAYEQEDLAASYQYLMQAFDQDFPRALHSVIRSFTGRIIIIDRLGKEDEFADRIEELARNHEDAHVIPSHSSPESLRDARDRRRRAQDRGLPSALMVSMPKSATVSIGNILSSGFDLPTVLYAMTSYCVIPPWIEDFLHGGSYYANHLVPSDRNIERLVAASVPNVMVNVRDPRQQIVSVLEHDRRYPRMTLPSRRPTANGVCQEQAERAVEEIFPASLAWIDGWVKAQSRLPVHFTTFEEFALDRDRFVDRLLSIYGGDLQFFDRRSALEEHAGIDYHRRLGRVDEWREIFSPEQTERMNRQIPNEYWGLFGWTP